MKKTPQKTKLELKRKPVVQLKPDQLKAVTGGGSTCRCITLKSAQGTGTGSGH